MYCGTVEFCDNNCAMIYRRWHDDAMISHVHVTDSDISDGVGGGRLRLLIPSLEAPQYDFLQKRGSKKQNEINPVVKLTTKRHSPSRIKRSTSSKAHQAKYMKRRTSSKSHQPNKAQQPKHSPASKAQQAKSTKRST